MTKKPYITHTKISDRYSISWEEHDDCLFYTPSSRIATTDQEKSTYGVDFKNGPDCGEGQISRIKIENSDLVVYLESRFDGLVEWMTPTTYHTSIDEARDFVIERFKEQIKEKEDNK